MHVKGLLHKMLSAVMHKKRLETLIILVMTALIIKKLSVTQLGRGINLPIQERSGIKRADRFLGNKGLYKEKNDIYSTIATVAVGNKERPRIIVDWSEIPNAAQHVLRAAKITDGRAITIYERFTLQRN